MPSAQGRKAPTNSSSDATSRRIRPGSSLSPRKRSDGAACGCHSMPARESVTRSDYAAGYLSTMAATVTAAADPIAPTPATGLTSAEVGARRAKGLGNKAAPKTGRGYTQILRENVFQFTNNIMFGLAIGLVLVGRPFDALLSVGVVMTNVIV